MSSSDNQMVTGAVFTAQEAAAIEAQTKGEIDVQIATAKRYPREITRSIERIRELATRDQRTAEKCWYALPRGGKVIEGPSVRMAEIVAASWGNLRATARVVGIDAKYVTCQGGCIDLETNFGASVEVKRRITDKNGRRFNDDMIMTTSNAASAIAFRNAIFKVIPGALINEVMEAVKNAGMGSERTFGEQLKAMLSYFKGLGVEDQKIFDMFRIKGKDDLTLEHVRVLRGLATAIDEGTTTIEEAFDPPKLGKKVDLNDAPNGGRVSMRKGKPKEEAKGDALSVDEMKTILGTVSKKKLKAAKKACGFDDDIDVDAPDAVAILYAAVKELNGGE